MTLPSAEAAGIFSSRSISFSTFHGHSPAARLASSWLRSSSISLAAAFLLAELLLNRLHLLAQIVFLLRLLHLLLDALADLAFELEHFLLIVQRMSAASPAVPAHRSSREFPAYL